MMSARISPLMRVPVPWVFVMAYLAGALVQRFAPSPVLPAGVEPVVRGVGVALWFAGGLLAAWSLRLFQMARTTTTPFHEPSRFVTWGPYRFTRNPMYVALTTMYLAEAAVLVQLWPLLLLPLVVVYVDQSVIPVEEANLRRLFGAEYDAFCQRVPRWLGRSSAYLPMQ